MKRTWIQHATLVNEGQQTRASLIIEHDTIAEILPEGAVPAIPCQEVIDATGCYLLPGVIDNHVHFREPGLTQKADIASESRAAAAGGVTTVMDMPNTTPQTTTLEAWEEKMQLFAQRSVVNYSCFFGATNQNYGLLPQLDRSRVCGVKIYMGSSTGNMLVDRMTSLQRIFGGTDLLIATHCEDQDIIRKQTDYYKSIYGDEVPLSLHPWIRSEEACYRSSAFAIELAQASNARLHIMHISTAKELSLFTAGPIGEKRITAEACTPHLCFTDLDYIKLGARVKCNPSVKRATDREAIRQAINNDTLDLIATDHAPHLLSDKLGGALKAASGIPVIQYSLVSMLELVHQGIFTLEKVVEKMCHAPATLYQLAERGYLRPGYKADLVLVRPVEAGWEVTPSLHQSKCGWSPFDGSRFHWQVVRTYVNGHAVYQSGQIDDSKKGEAARFAR